MFRGEDEKSCAGDCVGAGREDGNRGRSPSNFEVDFGALGATDPVFLHRFNLFGPIEGVDFVEEFVGVGGYLKEPLFHFFLFDFSAATPTMTVFDLFVREDGFVLRTPPLIRLFLIGETLFKEFQKTPLSPAIIVGVGGIYFAIPVDIIAETFELGAEIFDVGFGRDFRGDAGFDCVILGRETKSIIAKGTEDVKTLLGVETGQNIDNRKIADVSDVETGARGVRKHLSEEFFRLFRVKIFSGRVEGAKRFFGFPSFLPFFLNI